MAKLNVRKECFETIKGFEKKQIIKTEEQKKMDEEARENIKAMQIKRLATYERAKKYFSE